MKKFYVTVNPHGGRQKGLRLLKQIRPFLESAGHQLDIHKTQSPGHARALAQQLDFNGFDGMIVIGGDGTMHEVLNGLLTRHDKRQLPIGLIPGGSGNSLMVDLGLADPLDAVKAIVSGHTRKFDVVELQHNLETPFAFNIIGWGLATDVGVQAEKWRWLGPARYTIASLFKVLRGVKPRPATLKLDDQEITDNFAFIIACNTRYTSKMKIAPKAKLNDGLVDVIVVRHGASRFKLLTLLNRIYDGTHVQDPLVEYYLTSRLSLIPQEDEILNIDGELGGSTPLELQVRPQAFEMFAPHVD